MFTMKLLFYVFFMCAFTNVFCENCNPYPDNKVLLDRYAVYLMGFTILFMFIAIVCLSVFIYMIKTNRKILGISLPKAVSYIRQESGQGVNVCNYSNTLNDTRKSDGSTLSVNSGTIEFGGLDEPVTPTCPEPKDEKKPPYYMKKPMVPIIPDLQKAQMDALIKQVLSNKRQERGSASLRELDALANPKTRGDGKNSILKRHEHGSATLKELDTSTNQKTVIDKKEPIFKRTSMSLNNLEAIANEETDDTLYENLAKIQHDNKVTIDPKPKEKNTVDILTDLETYVTEDEQEVYDTLPNPVRCKEVELNDVYIENLPVYDSVPKVNYDKGETSSAVMDQDTEYLLLLSKSNEEDKASYINAKVRDLH